MASRIRADQLVHERGLAESREKAKALIMAGRVCLADNPSQIVTKPGNLFLPDVQFKVTPGKSYVSRGAHKLLTLLDGFQLSVEHLVCLDAGASTGGFTDCLLQRGAARVYAIDVGKNQLHEKLRNDPRVISMEGVNLRYAPASLLPEQVDFLTGDLSFISLTLVLPACMPWLRPGARLALLIKPQFELDPAHVRKGVVREESLQMAAVEKIRSFCQEQLKLEFQGVLPAKIRGPKGNQEYMALFQRPDFSAPSPLAPV